MGFEYVVVPILYVSFNRGITMINVSRMLSTADSHVYAATLRQKYGKSIYQFYMFEVIYDVMDQLVGEYHILRDSLNILSVIERIFHQSAY